MRKPPFFLVLSLAGTILADTGVVGRWDFEDASDPAKATTGLSLDISGPVVATEGPTNSDKAIHVPKGSVLRVAHAMPVPVNEFSITFDLRISTDGTWRSLFQTNPRNTDDADCFVRQDGAVGVMATGYSSPALFSGQWHRLVVSVKNGSSYALYLDGRKILDGTPQPIGGRFTLADTLSLFADDDGETDAMDLARVTIHSHALDETEAGAMGSLAAHSTTAFSAGPWLQAVSDSSTSILWETATSAPGWVEYGTTSALGSRTDATSIAVGTQRNVQRARLRGLAASTTYQYRIASDTFRSTPRTFRTAPSDRSARIRFGIWGDSHQLHPAQEMFAYMVDSLNVDFAVTTGDISNDGNNLSDLQNTFLPLAAKGIGSHVPFFAALGNHDVAGYASPKIRSYLDQPRDINSDPNGISGSYVAAYGPVALVALDWTRMDTDIPGWLDRQLKSDYVRQFPFVFAFIHRAPYYERWQAAGEDANLQRAYPPILEGNGVHASFSGHMHGYERGFKNGTFYCTTGGSSYLDATEPIGKDYPFITVGAFEASPANFGLVNEFMTIDADANKAIARMHAFDASGRALGVLDSFEMKPRSTSRLHPAVRHGYRFELRGRTILATSWDPADAPLRLRLLDAQGRAVLPTATGSREIALDLGGLRSGCYIAQVSGASFRNERTICLP